MRSRGCRGRGHATRHDERMALREMVDAQLRAVNDEMGYIPEVSAVLVEICQFVRGARIGDVWYGQCPTGDRTALAEAVLHTERQLSLLLGRALSFHARRGWNAILNERWKAELCTEVASRHWAITNPDWVPFLDDIPARELVRSLRTGGIDDVYDRPDG